MLRMALFSLLVLCAVGCSGKGAGRDSAHKLNERSRDSLIARSRLPGAGVMGKAIAVSDSAAARAKRLNAQMK